MIAAKCKQVICINQGQQGQISKSIPYVITEMKGMGVVLHTLTICDWRNYIGRGKNKRTMMVLCSADLNKGMKEVGIHPLPIDWPLILLLQYLNNQTTHLHTKSLNIHVVHTVITPFHPSDGISNAGITPLILPLDNMLELPYSTLPWSLVCLNHPIAPCSIDTLSLLPVHPSYKLNAIITLYRNTA